uniref:Putative wrp salivary protein n=1 Tax=Culex tarsalis TaxID=7177 RepID=A0A1Q3FU70_CULTA
MHSEVILLLLVFLVDPAVLADIPTGCVSIKSPLINRYLTKSTKYDKKRRHISWGYTDHEYDKWMITPDGPNYRIKHAELQEELYESEIAYNGNYVFTWIPKDNLSGDHERWKITMTKDGYFLIKNVQFNHCLYMIGTTGWLSAYDGCDTMHYKWIITKIDC